MNLLEANDLSNYSFVDAGSGIFDAQTKRMIVLAPNGSGKTTLCKALQDKYGAKAEILSFSKAEVNFKGAKNSLLISADDAGYQKALSDYEEVENAVGKKAVLGSLGLKETQLPPECKARFAPIIKGTMTTIVPLTEVQRKGLSAVLDKEDDIKRMIRDFDTLKGLSDAQAEVEATLLSLTDVSKAYALYHIEEHVHDIERDGCPFCGAKMDDTLQHMRAIYQKVTSNAVVAFRDYSFASTTKEKDELKKCILTLLGAIRTLTDDQVLSLAITLGNPDMETKAQKLLDERSARKKAKSAAEAAQNAFYKDMQVHLGDVQRAVKRYSPTANVELLSSEKAVKISLPRKYDTYSEGEKRDIFASIQLEIARSKAIEVLIVDDPFVSLDNCNQHRTVYRLASYAHLAQQAGDHIAIIVFTCDYAMLNIAHEQRQGLFSFAYLNSFWNADRTKLNVELMPMPPETDAFPYIGYQSLLALSSPQTLSELTIYAIERRAELVISGSPSPEKEDYNRLLHYDSPVQITVKNHPISNDDLVGIIDGPLSPVESSFVELLKNNILYLAALRVWVEKKLYEYDQYRAQNNESRILVAKKGALLLHKKIILYDKVTSGTKVSDYYPRWDKSVLMSMKTLLNENDHPYSMTDPFGYPMSISRQALLDEIQEIKAIFSRP